MAGTGRRRRAAVITCTENNHTFAQACLLADSLRRLGGTAADLPLYGLSVRKDWAPTDEQLSELQAHGIEPVVTELNARFAGTPQANKIFACLWAVSNVATDYIAYVDTDSCFVGCPQTILDAAFECAARPVWLKGIGSEGPDDPADDLWSAARDVCRVPESTRMTKTSVSGTPLRPYYNTGLLCFHRESGLAESWLRCFSALSESTTVAEFLDPEGAGPVRPGTNPRFFLEQMAFSLALDDVGVRHVEEFDPRYNVAVDCLDRLDASLIIGDVVHLHYLRYFNSPTAVDGLLERLPCEWVRALELRRRLPMQPTSSLAWPSTFAETFDRAMNDWRDDLKARRGGKDRTHAR